MAELVTSSQKPGRGNRHSTHVDLTAMVDLAFLLITFFMLTTTLSKSNAMDIAMPDKEDAQNTPVPASRTLTLCLGNNNSILIYKGEASQPITAPKVIGFNKNGLRKELIDNAMKIKVLTGKQMIVLVKPGEHSFYENLVNTIDELNIANVQIFAIVDETPADVRLLKKFNLF